MKLKRSDNLKTVNQRQLINPHKLLLNNPPQLPLDKWDNPSKQRHTKTFSAAPRKYYKLVQPTAVDYKGEH